MTAAGCCSASCSCGPRRTHLIVAPSNLAFQWQRELKEKFDETFLVMKGGDLRAQFGVNRWMQQAKVVISLDLAKREDILPGLRQTHWDLVIVDEAPSGPFAALKLMVRR